jgi:arsenite/tail-anchored protein-transporting ATPase
VDAERTSFVIVTRAAALPRAESVRLLRRLQQLNVHVPLTIVNAIGRGACARCRTAERAEHREVIQLSRELPRTIPIVLAPAELPPPHEARSLLRWQRSWRPHGKIPVSAGISSKRVT